MAKQSQPFRVENPKVGSFATVQTEDSALWFVNSPEVEHAILGRLAQYRNKFGVVLYAFVFSGSHFHPLAKFPNSNRASFYRDLNARAAEAVKRYNDNVPEGSLFYRRYSEQALPLDQDIEERFFYCALQPVAAGLCRRLSDYPGYNSFTDAISGIKRKFKVVDWAGYNAARRHNKNAKRSDFTTEYALEYARLPGYESMSQEDYKKMMLEKLEERRAKLVRQKLQENPNHRYMTKEQLRKVVPGTLAKNPKRSTRADKRPLVLCCDPEAREQFLSHYFMIYEQFKRAVSEYLKGNFSVVFPPGTYRPPGLLSPHPT